VEPQEIVDGEHGGSHLGASASTILPVVDATRAVPTIGATAARTPRTRSGSTCRDRTPFQGSSDTKRTGLNCDERGDANEHECFRIETRCRSRVRGHVCEQIEDGVSLVDSAMVLPFVARAAVRTVVRGIQQKGDESASSTLGESTDVSDVWHHLGAFASRRAFIEQRVRRPRSSATPSNP
jgi:hypothetical protein